MKLWNLYLILYMKTFYIYFGSGTILHPASSIFALIPSISVPITELYPERRIFFDWGFQMSYDLPANLSSFYNTPIWPHVQRSKRDLIQDVWTKELKYPNYVTNIKQRQHVRDFTAGELYQGLEDFLVGFGYHESCLMRTICEFARSPFTDEQDNILSNALTFILSPSLHKGFAKDELLYKDLYEAAEMYGFLHENCEHIYADCHHNLLSFVTQIIRK